MHFPRLVCINKRFIHVKLQSIDNYYMDTKAMHNRSKIACKVLIVFKIITIVTADFCSKYLVAMIKSMQVISHLLVHMKKREIIEAGKL